MTKIVDVLIVEDDEWLVEQYERVLTAAGFRVEHAAHALAAIDRIDLHRPDVLVLDLLLVGPNAFALLHELQSHADLAIIPVILCTNNADQISVDNVEAYGVSLVIDKITLLPEDLIAAIKKVLP